jgi:hypothetical protein
VKLVAPRDPDWHRPFTIADGPSADGPRLGGRPPAIERPELRAHDARYVLTFPLSIEPPLDASVFVNCDFETLLDAMNDGIFDDDRVVVVVHEPAPRGGSDVVASELSSHPIVVGEPAPDWVDDGEGGRMPMSSHKLGGRPYCIQEPALEGADELLASGWVHVLQLDFPARSSVRGNWPFADGLFHVFIRPGRAGPPRWAFQK